MKCFLRIAKTFAALLRAIKITRIVQNNKEKRERKTKVLLIKKNKINDKCLTLWLFFCFAHVRSFYSILISSESFFFFSEVISNFNFWNLLSYFKNILIFCPLF